MVPGKDHFVAWSDFPVFNFSQCRNREGKKQQTEESPPSHQSSRTARTGPMPMASPPLKQAVSTASAT
ncbi:MAG TPA: hypothetical protein VFX09_05100, partial [Burkholderiales bacterium]|nr:hypothetical protein [Burkholderiales bacterium]